MCRWAVVRYWYCMTIVVVNYTSHILGAYVRVYLSSFAKKDLKHSLDVLSIFAFMQVKIFFPNR